ncbi:epithelial sodium channel subunit beta-like [Rhipicephalus microplus]|uniref:epithelial sodium channel subunit beta-like n=1 Tax=Rhipicephalus microplus TaxID=6941 RepID=UPI003F6B241D
MHVTERSVVRAAIWLVSLTGFLWQTGIILKMYFQYPFSVTVVEELQKGILFPALTVCTENWINKSAYCALSKNNCDDNYQPRPDRLSALGHDWEVQAKVAISAGDMFECYLRSTDPTCSAMPCKENIVRTYFRHPGHMCYTLDLIEYAQSESTFLRCKIQLELEMKVYWSKRTSVAIADTNKFPVIVHRPETCPPDKLSAIVGETDIEYVLSVTQQTVKRLPPPYASKCTEYTRHGKQRAYGGYLNQDTCLHDCEMRLQTKHCGCVYSALAFTGAVGATACDPGAGEVCVASLSKNNTFKPCLKKCRAPCMDTAYDVRLTGMGVASYKWLTNDEDCIVVFIARTKLLGLTVKFSSDTQKIFVYEPNLTIVEAFGYMGGYLGMWLGFSLLSILKGLEEKILDFFFGSGRVTSIRIRRDATKEDAIHSSLNHRMLNRRVRALRMGSY